MSEPLVNVRGLSKTFSRRGFWRAEAPFRAVTDVSFSMSSVAANVSASAWRARWH